MRISAFITSLLALAFINPFMLSAQEMSLEATAQVYSQDAEVQGQMSDEILKESVSKVNSRLMDQHSKFPNAALNCEYQIQIAHMSADPEVEFVDVYTNGSLAAESLGFREWTSMECLDDVDDEELLIEITKAGEEEVIISKTKPLPEFYKATVVFYGLTEPDSFLPNPDGKSTALNLAVLDFLFPMVEGNHLHLFHAATDLPEAHLVSHGTGYSKYPTHFGKTRFAFVNLEPYPHTEIYDLEIRDPDSEELIAAYRLHLEDLPQSFILYLSGFENSSGNQNGASLNAFAVGLNGEKTDLPDVTGSVNVPPAENPTSVELKQNYPNPFNPTTSISFNLNEASDVRLSVYNITGQLVGVLVNELRSAGRHSVIFDGSALSSGVYLYQLQSGDFIQTRKMILVK